VLFIQATLVFCVCVFVRAAAMEAISAGKEKKQQECVKQGRNVNYAYLRTLATLYYADV